MKLAVIGTAGRKGLHNRMDYSTYYKMYARLLGHLQKHCKDQPVTLISGGAAWSDHLAVTAWRAQVVDDIHLYLPCYFDLDKMQYEDSGLWDWRENPGKTANYHHQNFQHQTEIRSLAEVGSVVEAGKATYHWGFYKRNQAIAEACDAVLAYTNNPGNFDPAPGGTRHTWAQISKLFKPRFHVDISPFLVA